jgi:hypothetical protein
LRASFIGAAIPKTVREIASQKNARNDMGWGCVLGFIIFQPLDEGNKGLFHTDGRNARAPKLDSAFGQCFGDLLQPFIPIINEQM